MSWGQALGAGLFERVREVNRTGRLYPAPPLGSLMADVLEDWREAQLVEWVPGTETSVGGYVAFGTTGISSMRRELRS